MLLSHNSVSDLIMTITLELSAEIERQLELEARMHGKDIPAYLLESVQQRMRPRCSFGVGSPSFAGD